MTRFAPVLLALAAVVYFADAYLPVGLSYFRARAVTWAFAQELAQTSASPAEIRRLVKSLRQEAGIDFEPRDVHVRREGNAVAAVQLKFKVPLHFPLLGGGRPVYFAIGAKTAREAP
jgi:hypothetical protein